MKAEQGEFESLASFYRVCDGRASYHQTVSLDAVQLFKFLELLYEGLFVLARHLRAKLEHYYAWRMVLAYNWLKQPEHTHVYNRHFGGRNRCLEYAVEMDFLFALMIVEWRKR